LFNNKNNNSFSDATDQLSYDIHRGLALLMVLTLSVVGASWLFSVPVYFDLKIAAQIFPLIYSLVIFFAVTRIQNNYLYKLIIPFSFIVVYLSWSYVIYLNAGQALPAQKNQILHIGMANSMYLIGLALLSVWLARYFRFSHYLSVLSIITLSVVLSVLTKLSLTFLLAVFILLAGSIAIASFLSLQNTRATRTIQPENNEIDEDMLLPEPEEEQYLTPELEINALPLNESSATHDWELVLRELHGELRNTSDVDQLFKRMLVFMHGAMEFDGAAVGMLQDKSIRKIATFGGDELLHTQSLSWTSQRINELFSTREPVLSRQAHMSRGAAVESEPLHRLDVPVISNNKVVGLVTLFRETLLFDTNDIKLASSIVFHSMVALRQARLQDEVKRLSSGVSNHKLTVYSREQFVSQVKPVFEKLAKPRECSLFIVEIDTLDSVIDKIGREAGMMLYKSVSNVIISNIKETDIIGKYGNEGFIVLMEETDIKDAKAVAELIRSKVEANKLKYQEHVITTTVSIGLTIVSDPEDDLPSLMRKADMGLFVAKENGCNTVKVSL